MEREDLILKSCKIIQREIKKLNKMNCSIDLSYHELNCYDNTIKPLKGKYHDGDNQNFETQVKFNFSQHKDK